MSFQPLKALIPLAAVVWLLAAGLPPPRANAQPIPPPPMLGTWLGLTQPEADPTLLSLVHLEITGQERRRFDGRFIPSEPVRLTDGELPAAPALIPTEPMSFAGTVAATGLWNAVAHRGEVTPHAVLHGRLASFADGLLFSEGAIRFIPGEPSRFIPTEPYRLSLLQRFAIPGNPVTPSLVGTHDGEVVFDAGPGSVDAILGEPVRLLVGAEGQAGMGFAASGLFGDAPFLLVGTLIPPNPVVPPNPVIPGEPMRALILGGGVRGVLDGAYAVNLDHQVTRIEGRLLLETAGGVRMTGTLSLEPTPLPSVDL